MKLNNKGFVSSTLMYSLLLLFLFLILGLIALLSNRKMILDKLKNDIKEEVNSTKKYTYYENGTPIYYNPKTGKICGDYTTANSVTGVKEGCLKFYTFNDDINRASVNMILDHNTTAKIAYETSGTYKEYSQASIKNQVDSDTTGWVGNPRLITADEVATISKNTEWKSSTATTSDWFCLDTNEIDDANWCAKSLGTSNYKWLFDYTDECTSYGCNAVDSSNSGYWTNSPASNNSARAWRIGKWGSLYANLVGDGNYYGIRPVINVSKKDLKFGGTKVNKTSNDTHKGIIYMDPTNLTKMCTEQLANANVDSTTNLPTGIKKGCMKFYIFDDSNGKYKLILDHNTSGNVAWANKTDYIEAGGTASDWDNNSKFTELGPVTAIKQLNFDTKNWTINTDLISANDVAKITGAYEKLQWRQNQPYGTTVGTQSNWFYLDGGRNVENTSYSESKGWQKQYATSQGASNYAWLFNYTENCKDYGCDFIDSSTKGFWTKDSVTGDYNYSWIVSRIGHFGINNPYIDTYYGVRPVVELYKTILN